MDEGRAGIELQRVGGAGRVDEDEEAVHHLGVGDDGRDRLRARMARSENRRAARNERGQAECLCAAVQCGLGSTCAIMLIMNIV